MPQFKFKSFFTSRSALTKTLREIQSYGMANTEKWKIKNLWHYV